MPHKFSELLSFFKPNKSSQYSKHFNRLTTYPSSWRWDDWVTKQMNRLQVENSQLAVLWPTGVAKSGETELSQDDLPTLKALMDNPTTTTIAIPQNTGNHWFPICLERNREGGWKLFKIRTKTDGTCGDDLVNQVEKVARQGYAEYQKENPTKLTEVQSRSFEENIRNACLISLSETEKFDFELSQLAKHEQGGSDPSACAMVRQTQSRLVDLMQAMSVDQQNKAINRLYESGLADKPSIAKVLDTYMSTPSAKY